MTTYRVVKIPFLIGSIYVSSAVIAVGQDHPARRVVWQCISASCPEGTYCLHAHAWHPVASPSSALWYSN